MPPIPDRDVLTELDMKTSRAQFHLDALQAEMERWLKDPNNLTIREHTDFNKALHIFRIDLALNSKLIPVLLGDFLCCLRSALEQLAWGLAHLDTKRGFTEKEERNISFLIFKQRDSTYEDRRALFPSAVAEVFDSIQPYLRGNAYRDDPLWQLNELWTMDKHRAIPMNCNVLNVSFPAPLEVWAPYARHFEDRVEVHFPLTLFLSSEVHLKPTASADILFGERMGQFEISRNRLREINDFVRNDVIPRFTGFFP